MANIRPDQLENAVKTEMAAYYAGIVQGGKEAIDRIAKETVAELKVKSPKRTGNYARTWKSSTAKGKNNFHYSKTVHNEKNYRLTHLLENGHAKVNGGRTKAIPHIGPAEEQAVEKVYRAFTELAKG